MHSLVSGIPASGKCCHWLEEKKGFLHLDVEKTGVLDRHRLVAAWAALFGASTSAASFVQALEKFKRPVAIDWGFPPESLDTVRQAFFVTGATRGRNADRNPPPRQAGTSISDSS